MSKSSVSAHPIDHLPIAPNCERVQPLYFGSGDYRVFGWLHRISGESPAPMGLVICKPFGFEAMSAHLSVRAFAEAAAEIGIPALRFDYGGTGDSEDLAPGADQIKAWTQDVIAAVQELRRLTGVERVCLLGIRLGALLAATAAARIPQVSALIAVAPIISGRRYLREMRTFELAAAQTQSALAPSEARTQSREADLAGSGHMEVSGFFVHAKTMTALQQVDLLTSPPPPVTDALVIDPLDLPGARAWSNALVAAGIRTQYVALPGFVEMIMRPPNLTAVPEAMIAAARDWLAQIRGPRSGSMHALNSPSGTAAFSATLHLRGDSAAVLAEQPVVLRSDPLLFGIVTDPAQGEIRRRGVILLNSGGDHHIGPRRFHVSLAREWAKRGYVVMRMDLSGLGDSAAQPGQPRNELFPIRATDDIRVAVDYMRSRHQLRELTLAGMCSGASHAVRAGMEGVKIDRVLAINPLIFFWQDGLDVNDVQPWEVVHKPAAYLSQIGSLKAWRRLLFGDVSISRVARIYLNRPIMALRARLRDLARGMRIPLKNDLRLELKKLKKQGVRVVFVFSRGDAGMRLLELQSGLTADELAERYCIRTIDGADHEFTRSAARAALVQALSEELFAPPAVARPSAANDPHTLPLRQR
jgi:alpha-beta hydrolase superfamily lysophospholipase